jgi:hypothetical protein
MNFDDLINAVGARHYFVTRWTAYYPVYIIDRLVDPLVGRLLWRWLLAGAVIVAFADLGRRLGWRRRIVIFVSGIVLSMPMFLRAFMTDYVEYLVVALGICLVVLCLRERQTIVTSLLIGSLAAAMLVANPISLFAVGLACLAALILERGGWARRARLFAISFAAGVVVVGFGLLLFRWRYGLENVYEPSITFARTYQGDPDAWKSPRLEWLGRFTWLYGPPLLLLVAVTASWRRRFTWSRVEWAALLLCAVQYLFQWIDQFVRDGFGLELSFYWSFTLPSFLVAVAIVLARFLHGATASALGVLGAAVTAFLLIGAPAALNLPPGWWFLALALGAVGVLGWVTRRWVTVGSGGLVLALLWTQIGAPPYDPSPYFFLNTSPYYDAVIGRAGDQSDMIFDEAMWFAEQMDHVPNDASASFISAGGWSSSISGLYAPHVTGRIIYPESGTTLSETTIREIKSGFRPVVAIFGDPSTVAGIYDDLLVRAAAPVPILDQTRQIGLGYRLVVLLLPDATRLPFTWTGDLLPRIGGEQRGTEVQVSPPAPAGFFTYGPYTGLPAGRYQVTYRYRSGGPDSSVVGAADAAVLGGASVASIDLPGSSGRSAEAVLNFESTQMSVWEFRTSWTGSADLVIESVTLASRP